MVVIHLCAKNDPSGNPQRLYLVFNSNGSVRDILDEGYTGIEVVRKKYPDEYTGSDYPMSVSIMRSEYHRLLRWWGDVTKNDNV